MQSQQIIHHVLNGNVLNLATVWSDGEMDKVRITKLDKGYKYEILGHHFSRTHQSLDFIVYEYNMDSKVLTLFAQEK